MPKITERYLLQVKANQPGLQRALGKLFREARLEDFQGLVGAEFEHADGDQE
jgi:hypothetical protein